MAQQVVISFNANANFSDLVGEIQRANAAIGTLQTQLNGLGSAAFPSIQNINKQFIEGMRNSRMWSSSFVDVTNETREFGRQLDRGRLKLKDYFREFNLQVRGQRGMIRRLAEEQVKLQRSMLTTTVGPQGETRYMLSTPTGLSKDDMAVAKALRAEQFKIIGRSIQGVSTELINLGKNTQWAGRQLTVGLTVPLTLFAASAARSFAEVDKQLTRLAKVYGDVGGATSGELEIIRRETQALSLELAQALGAPASETIALAADIAATGKQGQELLRSVAETTRLSVLGEVDRQAAMEATLSLQNAFNLSTQELAESINFLNAVENQTSTSLQDLITAIPKAGPVVKSLGGDVKDLALFLSAMIEGGINASEAANALKSGLASIINPTKQTTEVMNGFGINIQDIVNSNAGDLVGTITALQKALDQLDPLSKSKAIEQLFGKFQFARMSALFDNLGKSGSQTLQVMELMGASVGDLAAIADRELSALTESASGKFQRQLETLRANLATTGESFLGIFTKVLGVVNKVLEGFNNLPDGVKNVITIVGALVGLAGPLIMLSGVFLNFFGYLVKSVGFLGRLFTGTKKFEMLDEQLMAVNLSGDKTANMFYDQARAADVARSEIDRLIQSLQRLTDVQNTSATGAAAEAGGLRFRPEQGTRSTDIRSLAEFSHLLPASLVKKQFGENLVPLMRTVGTYIPTDRDTSMAGPFQRAMGKNMPSLIVDQETSAEALRPYAEKFQNLTLFNDLNERELKALVPTLDSYAESQGRQLAAWKTFSTLNEDQARALRDTLVKHMSAGDAEKALQAIREAAALKGIDFDQTAKAYEEQGRIAYASGANLEERSRLIVQEFAKLEHGLLTSQSEMSKWLLTSEGNASGLAKNLANLTGMSVTQLSSIISTEEAQLKSQLSNLSVNIKSKAKALQGATVRYVNGVATIFDAAGIPLADQGKYLNNPNVQAAIRRLDQQAEELSQAATNRIIQTTTALAQAENAVATGGATGGAVPAQPKLGLMARVRQGYAGGGLKGAARGAGLGGMGTSMAMMGLGMATTMMPTGGAGDIAGGALMGASMGMMFGPTGAMAGAALGALIPAATKLYSHLNKLADVAALAANQYKIDAEFAKAAGVNLKTIGDIQLEQITGKSAEAATQLQVLAEAAREASTDLTTGALREKTKGAETFEDVRGEFESQFLSYLSSGVPEETARVMMAAILKAAGKEEFAPSLKMALNSLDVRSEGTPQNVQATKLALERTARPEILQGTQFAGIMQGAGNVGLSQEQLKAYTSTASMYGMGALNPQYTGLSQDQISLIMQAVEAYKDLNTEQQRVALSSATVTQQVDILGNSLANSNIDDFRQSVQEADAEGLIMAGSVSNLASKISGLGEMEKSVLKQFAANSVSAADQLTVLKLRTEGVISDISTLASLDKTQITIYLDYVISQQKAEAARKEAERIVGTLQPKPKSGGASGDSAQKKALQAKLKAIQEEERVEKNIAKLKELQLKYDEKRKKSVVDYLAALEAGDMEGALRAQIQMEQDKVAHIKEQSDLKKEIARDDEKARLQAQIDALEAGNAATNNLSNSVDKTKKEIMSLGDNLVKTFGVNGNIDSAIKQFNDSSELKALVKQMRDAGYTQQDINKFVETLREQIRAAVNAALASAQGIDLGLAGGKGFGSKGNPLPISGITPAGFRTSKDNAFFNKNFLNEEQKRKIVSDYKLPAGAFFEVANEVYRVGNDGDAVRQKNAFERGEFGPDAARGKWAGGMIKKYGVGGYITGPGNTIDDLIPIMASNKEFMMRAKAVEHYGVPFMESVNNMQYDPGKLMGNRANAAVSRDESIEVNIGSINITEPGASADEIIARIKKDLGAAVKRSTDMRSMTV